MNKLMYLLGAVLIAGFAVLGVLEMQKSVTPYVTSVAEARSMGGRRIQFMGSLVGGKPTYDEASGVTVFRVADDSGKTLEVRYDGPRGVGIGGTDKVVVIGRYRRGVFYANDLLTKCPSKYEGR